VDVHDHDGRVLHIFGTGDIKVGELTQSLLREGDCFLDIGANYGSIGLAASGAVGVEGPVHLFEPQPPLATAIRKAIDGDALPQRLHLHQAAVSDRAGQLNLYCAPHHTGLASLSPDPTRRRDWNAIEVAVLDIYSVLQQHVAPRDFGVKLDIEGHEPKVLPAILDDPGCRFAITEACSNAEEIFTLCADRGFQIYGLEKRICRRRVRRLDHPRDLSSHHDVVAIRSCRMRQPPPISCSFRHLAAILD
jgi:FkbM family methyltransferase